MTSPAKAPRPTNGSGGREALLGAGPASLRLDLAVLRRRIRHEIGEEVHRGVRDLVDRSVKGFLVRVRRLREAADLADVLQRRRPDLVVGRGRLEVEERLDVSAHEPIVATWFRELRAAGP